MKRTIIRGCCLIVLTCVLASLIPVVAADTSEQSISSSLTRGGRFTVTITGQPNTAYYVWLPGTFTMTGEPYDQPPVITGSTENLIKDPEGGPYTIGSYQYNNGNGRTIRDEVAPSTANMSNTNYYAQVTTDATGKALVLFQTSQYTAKRSYSVKTENPGNPENENYNVQETVYNRGSRPMINTPVQTIATYPSRPTITLTQTPVPEETVMTTMPVSATTPIPTTTKRSPLDPVIAVVAVIAGFAAILRR